MLSPGDRVKDCEIIAPLGSGGMARLYLARRRGVGGFSRLVTLKLVHQHLAEDSNVIQLFLDEARISAHVAHPNVVHVEEVGQYAGSYFIAMEYVHGVSLAELLARLNQRRLRLRPKLAVWLAGQIAEALHAAHEAKGHDGEPLGIVHHDVSPQNVLLSHTGHVKLIDFGIAKSRAESGSACGRRRVLGKLRYMAPEQLRLDHADRRADVYALGVMLWEMLAGRALLRCQRFDDERDWATRENPPPPSRYSSQSTALLDRVVLQAIAYDPNDRFESAFQLRTALLRADPAAIQLDAPRVAALLRTTLGDELDRRRASWPSEVAGELDAAQELVPHGNIEELTAENAGVGALESDVEPMSDMRELPSGRHDGDDDDDAPTLALRLTKAIGDSFSALRSPKAEPPPSPLAAPPRAARAGEPVKVLPALMVPPREQTLLGMPSFLPASAIESAFDTLKCSPVAVRAPALLANARGYRAAMLGSICLACGVCLGAWLTHTPPRQVEVERDFAAKPLAAEPAAVFMLPPPAREPAPEPELLQPTAADPDREPDPVEDCAPASESEPNEVAVSEPEPEADPTRPTRSARKESRSASRRGAFRLAKHGARSSPKSSGNRKWSVRHARSLD